MTKHFKIPVQSVVDALHTEEFANIVVVGRLESGKLYVASSFDTQATIGLLNKGIEEIHALTYDRD